MPNHILLYYIQFDRIHKGCMLLKDMVSAEEVCLI